MKYSSVEFPSLLRRDATNSRGIYFQNSMFLEGGGGYGRKNALTQGDGYRKRLNIVHILELFLILFISTVTDNSLPFSVFLRRISEKAK